MKAAEVHKIGVNKGAPRVYLQGAQPMRAGFKPGSNYTVEVVREKNMVVLKVCEAGNRVVSRKELAGREVPVIDINSKQALGLFEGMESIRAIIGDNVIYLLPLATELRKKERLDRLHSKLEKGEPIAVGSLNHGGGVLDHALHTGLKQAGIDSRLAFANDIDLDVLSQAQAHNEIWDENTQYIGMPMQELAFDEYAVARLSKVDILAAGIPCAAHSVAARAKKGHALPEDDPEFGHLMVAFLSIIARVNPAAVLLENVEPYRSSASMSIIRTQMRDMGYVVHERVLDASDWNCLEARVRMCMVAVTEGMEFDFDALVAPPKVARKLGEVLDDVAEDDPCWRPYDYLKSKEIRDAAKGSSFNMQLFDAQSSSIATLRKYYHKGGSTDPLLKHPSNPDLLRQLNANEHARCKDIPEHLIAGMSKTAAHELLGQSIAHPPFVAVASLLASMFKGWQVTARMMQQGQELLAA